MISGITSVAETIDNRNLVERGEWFKLQKRYVVDAQMPQCFLFATFSFAPKEKVDLNLKNFYHAKKVV